MKKQLLLFSLAMSAISNSIFAMEKEKPTIVSIHNQSEDKNNLYYFLAKAGMLGESVIQQGTFKYEQDIDKANIQIAQALPYFTIISQKQGKFIIQPGDKNSLNVYHQAWQAEKPGMPIQQIKADRVPLTIDPEGIVKLVPVLK